jgi:hypothetical protein
VHLEASSASTVSRTVRTSYCMYVRTYVYVCMYVCTVCMYVDVKKYRSSQGRIITPMFLGS